MPQGDQVRGSKSNGSGDVLFSPIQLGPLEVKNRLFRSSIAGRFDNYDGSGTPVRINWDLKFARGGAGAIISSNAPVSVQGRLVPGYALSDDDDKIPFWREVGKRIHEHDCKYILQLAHAGRERLVGGIEYATGLELDEQGRADERVPLPVDDDRRDPRGDRAVRAGGAPRARGRARRRRARRRERRPVHAVPLVGDQRPQGRVGRRRSRTARASRSRSFAR